MTKKSNEKDSDIIPVEGQLMNIEGQEANIKFSTPRSARVASFAWCLSNILGINRDDMLYIDPIIDSLNGSEGWYDPYAEFLKSRKGYDLIFLSYPEPLHIDEKDHIIENYSFPNIPYGQCIVMGTGKNGDGEEIVKSVVGISRGGRIEPTFDPYPDNKLLNIKEIGFFTKTFMDYEDSHD
jgi:hypothetical protein